MLFPKTTHRAQLLFDGGITLDGVKPITPDRTDLVRAETLCAFWKFFLVKTNVSANLILWVTYYMHIVSFVCSPWYLSSFQVLLLDSAAGAAMYPPGKVLGLADLGATQ